MVRVKHKSRRRGLNGDEGFILVGTTKYQIDENGEVDVKEEHSRSMLQGTNWVAVSPMKKTEIPAPNKEKEKEKQPPAEKKDVETAPKTAETKQQTQALPADLASVSRESLTKKADQLDIRVDRRMSKQKIAQLIEEAQSKTK